MSSQVGKTGHARWRHLLELHIDGELDPASRLELFGHLEECDECRNTLEAEERLVDHLSRLPRLVAPSDLRSAILREVTRERAEALQPITEDERYSALLRGDEPDPTPSEAPLAPGRRFLRSKRPAGRGRTTWQRLSPGLAVAFLIVSATLSLHQRGLLPTRQLASPALEVADPEEVKFSVPSSLPTRAYPDPDESSSGFASLAPEGPGTVLLVERDLRENQSRLAANSGREGNVPVPAELEQPIGRTLVLHIRQDQGSTSDSGRLLAGTVQRLLENDLHGQIRRYEQAEREGYRLKSFVVDLAPEVTDALVGQLSELRRHDEADVVRRLGLGRNGDFASEAPPVCCVGSLADFESRLKPVGNEAVELVSFSQERIRVLLVE